MASIFTFESDPPRVSSPWVAAASSGSVTPARDFTCEPDGVHSQHPVTGSVGCDLRLEAEPQEGPTEYKLHLLLRPRRSVSASGSKRQASGSYHSSRGSPAPQVNSSSPWLTTPPLSSSSLSRQHRLEQLTTQLLWRLQQSSPHHSTSMNNLILPTLPATTLELRAPEQPAKLLPGLEESNGALYEIGVSDDGTLVGITTDEMSESLTNLRAMAGSLGCNVEVLRMVSVGEGLRVDNDDKSSTPQTLYVAEAYVKPVLQSSSENGGTVNGPTRNPDEVSQDEPASAATVEQLRISLTGATTCGKSSLLGTLSTSTLDNGRGKSRLSLLKHRHEIASGVTSSVAQELVGYQSGDANAESSISVLNYAHQNVTTWSDIQTARGLFRSALLIDSAGHPRFRRTTVRGLVGWAPHWTFLCFAANEDHSEMGGSGDETIDNTRFSGANAHISMAHLELCLKLRLPMVVVITKFDEATRVAFRQLLSSLLTRLKDAGRKPVLMSNNSGHVTEADLQGVSSKDQTEVKGLVETLGSDDSHATVPIIFTSALKGTGIAKLHALLCNLPIRCGRDASQACPPTKSDAVFHIDDSFNLPISVSGPSSSPSGSVISGYLSCAAVSVGDILSLGPCPQHSNPRKGPVTSDLSAWPASAPDDPFLEPRSFNDALARTTSSPRLLTSDPSSEWRKVLVVSIRNLRLPVHTLRPDQVGTVGVAPLEDDLDHTTTLQLRKGMVLAKGVPSASHTITVRFSAEEADSMVVGSVVVVYCKTVRASARVVAVALDGETNERGQMIPGSQARSEHFQDGIFGSYDTSTVGSYEEASGFAFDDARKEQRVDGSDEDCEQHIRVTLQFVATKEYLEPGSQVLIMPSGGAMSSRTASMRDLAGGLGGFVGTLVERYG